MHAAMDFDKFEEELEIPRRFSSGKIGLRDDFEIDFNDISRASTPMSSMSTKSEGRRKDRSTSNHHASNRSRETKHHSTEDYKRKIARLKSELELEKAHNKQMYREKANEIKLIRESYAHDKSQEIRRIEQKMNMEKEKEVEILQKNLNRRKDEELQQVLKFKENEIKSLNERLEKEKKDSMDAVRYEEKQLYKRNVTKMQEEVKRLNDEKKKVEEDLKKKIRDESKRNKEVTEMKENYDAELRRIINESKKLAMGNLQKLKKAERALVEGAINEDDDISLPDRFTPFMDSLSRPLSRITPMSEASSRAPSVFDMKLEDLKLEDLRIEDMDIELLLASAAPAPSAFKAVTPRSANKSATGINSPGLPSKSPSVLSTKSPGPISLHSPSIHSEVESVSLSRRLSEDKDRQLQKKVTELQTQTQRLERKIGVLKTENETLKRKQNEQLPLEDKIKTLKKRNAELAAIARRLEEKAKHLQQENLKKLKEETGQLDNDYLKKMFARQRAKDLAEHAKAMLAKDREIEDLRKKCQELADQLSNSDILAPENMQMYEEKEELVSIIKQAAKERLLMEKQIAKTKPPVTTQAEAKKLKELETANEALQFEIKKLERVKSETEKIEEELAEKKIECEKLQEEIKKEKAKSRLLKDELEESNLDKSKLSTQVKELHAKLKALEKVTEECNILRLSLSEAQNECDVARNERNTLQTKVLDLENVVKTLQESADKLNKLENDYKVTKHKLNDKQSEILSIQRNNDLSRKEYEETIATLKVKLSELENTFHNQEQQHKNLTEEIKLLQAASYKPPSIDSGTYSEDLQTAHATVQESTSTARLDRVADGYHANNSKSVETGMNRALTAHPKQNETKKVGNQASDSQFEDPELIEISQKLKELEASDSEEELTPTGGKGHDLMMNNHLEPKMKTDSGNSQEESRLSLLGKKGPIHVYMAKYTYDPFQHSPNDNPDAELAISAGDYVLIYGDMDEDAFFEGELLDGRRGLVPSNFIEKVPDEDLSEFHAAMAAMGHIEEDGPVQASAVSLEQELNFDSSEETDEKQLDKHTKPSAQAKELPIEITSPGGDNSQNSTSSTLDISKSPTQLSTKDENTDLLCPVNLTLDRQLTNSILISWSPPPCLADDPDKLDIKAYHVFVDNEFKTIVRGHERTKALVENVDSTVVHRVSVRCISNKGTSEDAQCTLLIGKDAVPLPSQLTVCDISANSATVTWLPGNSNYQHSISLNGKEVRVLKPSICKYKLTGLAPSSENHIVVTAKPPTSTDWGDHLIARLTFKTIAGGLPDPPINVQVESGPQEGTLLLTWLPVTIDSTGFSNGALVKGYVVYADGKWTKEVIGATNDHVVLNSGNFKGFVPKQLVVRTVTQAGDESADSVVVRLPQSLIKEITAGAAKSLASEVASKFEEAKKGKPLSPDVALKRHEGSSQDMNVPRVYSPDDHYEDDFVDSSASSELSDIPEVEEDFHSEVSSRASTPKRKSPHADDLRRVKTKDGKLSASGHSASHHSSHNTSLSGDVTPVRSPILNRVVPAIEITRDSSSERGNSFDVSEDDAESPPKHKHRSRSSSPRRKSPENISSQDDDMTPRNTSFSPTVNNQSDETANKVKNIPGKHDSMHTNAHLPKISVINNVSKDDKSRRSPVQGRKAHGNHSTSSKTSDSPKRHKNINGLSDLDRDTNDNELKSKGTAHSSHKHPDVPSLNLKDIVDNSMEESGDIDSISGEINPPVVETCVRLFVALFDYDPHTMSPNVDALDEELPFKEGQIIKIYGDKDADGFYRGESNGRVGFVPCNMVSELQVDDPDLAEQLLRDSQESFHSNGLLKGPEDSSHYLKSMESLESGHSSQIIPNGLSPALGQPSGTMKRMIAMYDYDPQELSPNVDSEVELSFQSGDIIYVFGDMDDDGFYMGESNGQRGLVPSNFLQEAPLVEEESPTIKSNMNSASHRQKWDQPQWNQYHRIG